MYGPVCTVVWQGSAGNRRPYADQVSLPVTGYRDSICRDKASRCSLFQFLDHSQTLCEFRYAHRLTVADFLQRVLAHPSAHEFALCNLHDLGELIVISDGIPPARNFSLFFKYYHEYKSYSATPGNTVVFGGTWTLRIRNRHQRNETLVHHARSESGNGRPEICRVALRR